MILAKLPVYTEINPCFRSDYEVAQSLSRSGGQAMVEAQARARLPSEHKACTMQAASEALRAISKGSLYSFVEASSRGAFDACKEQGAYYFYYSL